MCPRISCPNCEDKSYHKGACESCAFDPLDAIWVQPGPLAPEELVDIVDGIKTINARFIPAPFSCIRFQSRNLVDVDKLAEFSGYRGPLFKQNPVQLFDGEEHGFDIVKNMADPYVELLTQN